MTKRVPMKWQWRLNSDHRGYDQGPDEGWEDYPSAGEPDIWWLQMDYRKVPA